MRYLTLTLLMTILPSQWLWAIDEVKDIALENIDLSKSESLTNTTTRSKDSQQKKQDLVVNENIGSVVGVNQNNHVVNHSCVNENETGQFLGWLDYQHCAMTNRNHNTALWLDRQISGEESTYDDDENAAMFMRTSLELNWQKGEGFHQAFHTNVRLDLPRTQKRFKLIIADSENNLSQLYHADNNYSSDNPTNFNSSTQGLNLALRWRPEILRVMGVNIDLGAKGFRPIDLFLRARANHTWALNPSTVLIANELWRNGTHSRIYSLSDLNIEHRLDSNSVFSQSNSLLYQSNNSDIGVQWSNGVSLSHQWPEHLATLSYGITASGQSRPVYQESSASMWLQYQRSFLRSWLYYNVVPRVNFCRNQQWKASPAIVFSIDTVFGQ